MEKNTEELKLVIELATDKGREEQKNRQLADKIDQLNKKIEFLTEQIAEKERENEQLKERIRLQEYMANSNGTVAENQSPRKVVVVKKFIILSTLKTVEYVDSLDDDHRIFAGHFLTHTLADGTPSFQIDQVTEMTRLEGCKRQRDLTDAIEKAAEKPSVQVKVNAGGNAQISEQGITNQYPQLPNQ